MSTTTASPEQATADLLLPLLQSALPTIVSCSLVDSMIVQANAQGCRVAATHKEHPTYTSDTNHHLFVKRVMSSDYVSHKKSWNDLRRTLFEKGFSENMVPTCHVAHCNLEGLVDESSVAWQTDDDSTKRKMPTLQETTNKGCFLVLDSMNMKDYYQTSPLTTSEALKCLEAVAQLHAAAWEDVELLQIAHDTMARGSYHLSTRNPKELDEMVSSWNHFVQEFGPTNASLFSQPSIQNLGRRMANMARYISQQLTPLPTDSYATLAHGDFKAMNVFLPTCSSKNAVMIDFASTGVGLGMSDVAMHVIHSVKPTLNDDEEEMELVQGYLQALQQAGEKYGTNVQEYPVEVAMRHYRLACVDYIRFIMGRFWKSASPASFEAKKDSMNTTLVNRDLDAAMAWIAKVDKYLAEFEREKAIAEENIEA